MTSNIGLAPFPGSIILVAVMSSQRDLEIARLLGWYRSPLRFAPKVINVDFLAFYQTAAFGSAHRWRIEYFAEVRGFELTSRSELFRDEPDHPRAQEEYYKIQLGPVQGLSNAILAGKWRRITFLYTTGKLFGKARLINDLVVHSDERDILWKSLRERALHSGEYTTKEKFMGELEPEFLKILSGLGELTINQSEKEMANW